MRCLHLLTMRSSILFYYMYVLLFTLYRVITQHLFSYIVYNFLHIFISMSTSCCHSQQHLSSPITSSFKVTTIRTSLLVVLSSTSVYLPLVSERSLVLSSVSHASLQCFVHVVSHHQYSQCCRDVQILLQGHCLERRASGLHPQARTTFLCPPETSSPYARYVGGTEMHLMIWFSSWCIRPEIKKNVIIKEKFIM